MLLYTSFPTAFRSGRRVPCTLPASQTRLRDNRHTNAGRTCFEKSWAFQVRDGDHNSRDFGEFYLWVTSRR